MEFIRWRQICLWIALYLPCLSAQLAPAPADPLLARIKSRAVENLKRVPNYTCTLSVERMSRAPDSNRFNLIDRVRLEVALIGGKELFAWPGSDKFEETRIDELIPGGTMVSGDFALFASSVFGSPSTVFAPAGETVRDGIRVISFSYVVPRTEEGYIIRTKSGEAIVGYHGSFWVDAQTLDLVRLEVTADGIPSTLGVTEAFDFVDYQLLPVGDSDFLLPKSSEASLTDSTGLVSRNRTQFNGCRQFVGESKFSFGERVQAAEAPATSVPTEISLPSGLSLDLRLETEIDSLTAAIGDAITGRVANDVKKDGQVVVPKGAVINGRITMFERSTSPTVTSREFVFHVIGLRFLNLQFGSRRADFTAWLADLGPTAGFALLQPGERATRIPGRQGLRLMRLSKSPAGLGVFQAAGDRVRLPRGFRMVWNTGDAPD